MKAGMTMSFPSLSTSCNKKIFFLPFFNYSREQAGKKKTWPAAQANGRRSGGARWGKHHFGMVIIFPNGRKETVASERKENEPLRCFSFALPSPSLAPPSALRPDLREIYYYYYAYAIISDDDAE